MSPHCWSEMVFDRDGIPDGKVWLRKYVLISKPSRWGKKPGRTIVHSPVINILPTATHVLVQAISGKHANGICFLPKSDIEKDSNPIYNRLRINKSPTRTPASGIALDDGFNGEFIYKKHDVFWISDTKDFRDDVPVVNLRTMETGTISLKAVCWYPKMQGPDGELMTVGGEVRIQRVGPSDQTLFPWVICQSMNSTKIYTKTVLLPHRRTVEQFFSDDISVKEIEKDEQRSTKLPPNSVCLLSLVETHSLYVEIYKSRMGDTPRAKSLEPTIEDKETTHDKLLPTPPQSPSDTRSSPASSDLQTLERPKIDYSEVGDRILSMLPYPRPLVFPLYRRSYIHPQIPEPVLSISSDRCAAEESCNTSNIFVDTSAQSENLGREPLSSPSISENLLSNVRSSPTLSEIAQLLPGPHQGDSTTTLENNQNLQAQSTRAEGGVGVPTQLAFYLSKHRCLKHEARKHGNDDSGPAFSAANPILMSDPTVIMAGKRQENYMWKH